MSKKYDIAHKLLVFSAGLITIIIILECNLFLFGEIYSGYLKSPPYKKAGNIKNTYTILCLGNSFTKGLGAPKGHSYPDHLQDILNNN